MTEAKYCRNVREFTKADGAGIFLLITIIEELSKVIFVHIFLLSLQALRGGLARVVPNNVKKKILFDVRHLSARGILRAVCEIAKFG